MTASVVIAAHNEAPVIAACLHALLDGAGEGEFDITVAANGCTDRTAEVAARSGVRVLDLPQAGKTAAINAADAVAQGFPRLYLDADILLTASDLRALCAALADGAPRGTLAVSPARRMELRGRPLLVRAYFAINTRLPVFERALFGRGAFLLSETGRGRFAAFPDVVADDLFVDSCYGFAEKLVVDDVVVTVAAPFHTRDLVRRLSRVRRGNAELRRSSRTVRHPEARESDRWSWLRDVVLRRPWLAPAALCYVAITLAASADRVVHAGGADWGHDASTRTPSPGDDRTAADV